MNYLVGILMMKKIDDELSSGQNDTAFTIDAQINASHFSIGRQP